MRAIVALRKFDYTRRFRKKFPDRARPDKVLYYLHIGKTGGSYVTDLTKNYDNFDYAPMPFIRLSHNLKYQHMPVGSTFVFGTRDPVSRFVSGFNSRKVVNGRKRLPRAERQAFRDFETPNDLAEAITSDDSAEKARAMSAMAAIYHVNAPHRSWFNDLARLEGDIKAGRAYRVRQENLNGDLRAALQANGFVIPQENLEERPRVHERKKGFSRQLSPTAEVNLRAHYEQDYAFLRWLDEQGLTGAADDVATS